MTGQRERGRQRLTFFAACSRAFHHMSRRQGSRQMGIRILSMKEADCGAIYMSFFMFSMTIFALEEIGSLNAKGKVSCNAGQTITSCWTSSATLEFQCSCCKPSSTEASTICSCTVTLVQSEVYTRHDTYTAHDSKMFPVHV